jgi:hypothetical protein
LSQSCWNRSLTLSFDHIYFTEHSLETNQPTLKPRHAIALLSPRFGLRRCIRFSAFDSAGSSDCLGFARHRWAQHSCSPTTPPLRSSFAYLCPAPHCAFSFSKEKFQHHKIARKKPPIACHRSCIPLK